MNTAKRIATGAAFGLALLGMGAGTAIAAPGDSATEPIVSSTPDPANPMVPCETGQTWSTTTEGKDAVIVYGQEERIREATEAQNEQSHLTYGFERRTRTYTPAVPGQDAVTKTTYGSEIRTRTFIPAVPGQDAVTHLEYTYQREVAKTKTEFQWEKHVSGTTKQVLYSGKVVKGTFSDLDYPGAGPVWKDGGSGPHNSTWKVGDTTYTSTSYTYVKTGVTREVPDGTTTETSGWVLSKPAGSGWTKTDTRTVTDKAAVPAVPESFGPWSGWTVKADGLNEAPVLPANTSTKEYRQMAPQTVTVTEAVPAVPESYGEWSAWKVRKSGLLVEPVLKADTATKEFRQTEPVKVIDSPAVDAGFTEWSEWEVTEKALNAPPVLPENTDTHEYRATEPRETEAAVPPVTTFYAYNNDEPCEVVVVPPVEKPEAPKPPVVKPGPVQPGPVEVTFEVYETPAPVVEVIKPAATVTDVAQPRLAQTGSEIPAIALSGLALVGAGGVMAAAAARRREVTN